MASADPKTLTVAVIGSKPDDDEFADWDFEPWWVESVPAYVAQNLVKKIQSYTAYKSRTVERLYLKVPNEVGNLINPPRYMDDDGNVQDVERIDVPIYAIRAGDELETFAYLTSQAASSHMEELRKLAGYQVLAEEGRFNIVEFRYYQGELGG